MVSAASPNCFTSARKDHVSAFKPSVAKSTADKPQTAADTRPEERFNTLSTSQVAMGANGRNGSNMARPSIPVMPGASSSTPPNSPSMPPSSSNTVRVSRPSSTANGVIAK
ncbi:MAG TPA: hypothetical protein EYP98_15055 [Planctomycetes bacterium]|nr:hypothetical protein [Planctomycetota bacterium]